MGYSVFSFSETIFSTTWSVSVTRSDAESHQLADIEDQDEMAWLQFFFVSVVLVDGRADTIIRPAVRAQSTRKSWISSRSGSAIMVLVWPMDYPSTLLSKRVRMFEPL